MSLINPSDLSQVQIRLEALGKLKSWQMSVKLIKTDQINVKLFKITKKHTVSKNKESTYFVQVIKTCTC